jgi:hypothetical protein
LKKRKKKINGKKEIGKDKEDQTSYLDGTWNKQLLQHDFEKRFF